MGEEMSFVSSAITDFGEFFDVEGAAMASVKGSGEGECLDKESDFS
jgi:hypothetical protein